MGSVGMRLSGVRLFVGVGDMPRRILLVFSAVIIVLGAAGPLQAFTGRVTAVLEVTVNRPGEYTVSGPGGELSGRDTRTFSVPAGTYRITAPGATDPEQRVVVKAGFGAQVTITFPGPPLRVEHVAVDGSFSCAAMADGSVACWWTGRWPRLTYVPGVRDVVDIDLLWEQRQACAVQRNGAVVCWRISASDTYDSVVVGDPTTVPGLPQIRAIVMAPDHGCALSTVGTVWCWGANDRGQLGTGDRVRSDVPVQVPALAGVVSVAAIGNGTCALLTDAGVVCWGGLTGPVDQDRLTPAPMPALSPATSIDGARGVICVVLSGGRVGCLRGGEPIAPQNVTTALQVSVDGNYACAVLAVRGIACWGYEDTLSGLLRIPRGSASWTDAVAVDVAQDVSRLSTRDSLCAVLDDGRLRCWNSEFAAVAPGTIASTRAPLRINGLPPARRVTSGEDHVCAVSRGSKVDCWGETKYLPGAIPSQPWRPVRVDLPGRVRDISSGQAHVCAVTSSGRLVCWGCLKWWSDGCEYGERRSPPTRMPISGVRAVSAGMLHTCALLKGGRVRCFGANDYGQLGKRKASVRRLPVPIPGLGRATAISAGDYFTCALMRDGTVKCWGCMGSGCGGNDPDYELRFARVPRTITAVSAARSITAGVTHACAMQRSGEVRCWGHPAADEYSEFNRPWDSKAVTGLRAPLQMFASGLDTYATLPNGRVYRWTGNGMGPNGKPFRVTALGEVVSAGALGQSAAAKDGVVRCWGSNYAGQLGRPPQRYLSDGVIVEQG